MPFRSEKQRRYLWKNHPKIAKDWTDAYGSNPQPTKKAKGGDLSIPKRVKGESIKGYIKRVGRSGKRNIKEYGLLPSRKEFKAVREEFAKRRREKSMGRKAEGGTIQKKNALKGTKEALKIIKKKPELVGPEKGTKQAKVDAALEKYKNLTDKQRRVLGLPPREKKEDYPSYAEGKEKAKEHREKLKKLLRKGTGYVEGWLGKKQGGRVKKNGPVRPIDIPWDAEKKKAVGGSVKKRKPWGDYNPDTDQPRPRPNPLGIKKKKHNFKKGGTVHPRNQGVAVPKRGLGSLIPRLAL